MNNYHPIRPIDELTLEVVNEINVVMQERGVEWLMVGAQAKVVLLENLFAINAGRATGDIDFAFAIESWAQYERVIQALVATGVFTGVQNAKQRLMYQSQLLGQAIAVDIIPFGTIQDENANIVWPPDMDIVMSVSGYAEALASALTVEMRPNLKAKVVSLPGLAILKVFAWSERWTLTEKDAVDLMTLLRAYHTAGNLDRIYANPAVLEYFGFDPELAGAWLLGRDVAMIIAIQNIQILESIIEGGKEKLILHMAKSSPNSDDALVLAKSLLDSFLYGLKKQLP